jgi:predicted permease
MIGETMHIWRDWLRDVRFAFRTLGRDRSFAAITVVILALAIGANIAVFSVVNTLLLRPLPFPNSAQLVWIAPPPTACGWSCATYSADAFEGFRAKSRAYQDVTGYEAFTTPDNLRLTGHGDPQPVTSKVVVANFFQVLGVQPARGRLFTADEVRGGSHPVAILTDAYWRRQFSADPAIVGRAIELNGEPITVVGVLPDTFDFGSVFSPGAKVDLFTPIDLNNERDWGNILTLIGRMKPGVTVAQALDDARRVEPELYFNVQYPQSRGRYKGSLIPMPLKEYVTGSLRRSLIVLWCAVGTILLIAGVNLSNLLLARGSARAKEFAVRAALGASRARIIRQLLVESVLLSGAGAALGLGLAVMVVGWLARQASLALPLFSTLRIDGQALGWTLLIGIFATVVLGLVPGVRAAAGNLQGTIKDSGPGAGLGRRHERVRTALVVSEIALACVLLVSAGLLLRSFLNVLDVDLGFEPAHAASIKVEYDDSASSFDAGAAKRALTFQRILTEITALPGVEAAGMADYLPLGPNRAWGQPVPQGKVFAPGELPAPLVYVVTPGFVRAMGMRMHGRDFSWSDSSQSERVVLINAYAARIYWPGEDAVGRILVSGDQSMRVIGVVDDVHQESAEGAPGAQIYYPVTQQIPSGANLVVRTRLPLAALAPAVVHSLRQLNPSQPGAEFRPIVTLVDQSRSPRRFFMLLVAAFAGLGVTLAALGIYGVISYSVVRKTQEIGVRMALGATAGRVQRDVLVNTLRLAVAGIAAGTLASIVSARLIASLLFGTTPWDVTTYASMVVLLMLVALVSGYLPARRASGIEPMVVLRSQ